MSESERIAYLEERVERLINAVILIADNVSSGTTKNVRKKVIDVLLKEQK